MSLPLFGTNFAGNLLAGEASFLVPISSSE
jgi:hypothetical protein